METDVQDIEVLRNEIAQIQRRLVRLKAQYDVQQAQKSIAEDIETALTQQQQLLQQDRDTWNQELEALEDSEVSDILDLQKRFSLYSKLGNNNNKSHDKHQRRNALFENLNRLAGITGFRVQYPNTSEYMLGIRFDISIAGKFSIPHYVIIRQSPPTKSSESHRLEIFQHTVPAFLPLKRLEHSYLNSNLKLFVSKVRASLVQYNTRKHTFENGSSGDKLRGVRLVEANPAFSMVKLALLDKSKRELLLECSEDEVVSAKIVNSVQEKADLPLLEAMRGGIIDLPKRLQLFFKN